MNSFICKILLKIIQYFVSKYLLLKYRQNPARNIINKGINFLKSLINFPLFD